MVFSFHCVVAVDLYANPFNHSPAKLLAASTTGLPLLHTIFHAIGFLFIHRVNEILKVVFKFCCCMIIDISSEAKEVLESYFYHFPVVFRIIRFQDLMFV